MKPLFVLCAGLILVVLANKSMAQAYCACQYFTGYSWQNCVYYGILDCWTSGFAESPPEYSGCHRVAGEGIPTRGNGAGWAKWNGNTVEEFKVAGYVTLEEYGPDCERADKIKVDAGRLADSLRKDVNTIGQ